MIRRGRLLADCGAQYHRILAGTDKAFDIFLPGIDPGVPSDFAQILGNSFQGIAFGIKHERRPTNKVLSKCVKLYRGPAAEVEKRKRLVHRPDNVDDRIRVEADQLCVAKDAFKISVLQGSNRELPDGEK